MDLGTDNSGVATADNPSAEPAASAATETGTTSGQAAGATPTGDLFKGIDPNTLSPKERASYDSMLRDYREKTGKLSETIKSEIAKATESYQQKATLYDQIAQQEEFVRQWNEYVQKTQSDGNAPKDVSGDPVLAQLQSQIKEMNQKIQISEISQITDAFADAVNEKGEKIHSDFDALNSITFGSLETAQGKDQYSLLRGCIELAPGKTPQEKLANGYKQAKTVYDSIFESGKKAGMGRLQAKVLNGTQPPSNSSGEVLSVTDKKPKNAREAMEMARRGQMVSRD